MAEKKASKTTNTKAKKKTARDLTPAEILVWKNAKLIKIASIVILAAFIFVLFSAANAKDIDLAVVEKTLKNNTDITDVMRKMKDRELMQFTGLNASDYEQVIYYRNTTALAVDEFLVVKARNVEELDEVEESIESRISTQLKYYDSYGPEQCALLKNAVQTKKGKYYCYCVAENADQYKEVLIDAIQ